MIDAGIVAVSAALLAWVYIVQPDRAGADLSPLETLVTVGYPFADVLVLAVAARFVIGSSWNVPALRLLVVGLVLFLVADTSTRSTCWPCRRTSASWTRCYSWESFSSGSPACIRSMTALTEGRESGRPGPSTLRFLLLGVRVPRAAHRADRPSRPRRGALLRRGDRHAMVALSGLLSPPASSTSHPRPAGGRPGGDAGPVLGRAARRGRREELFVLAGRAAGELARPDTAQVVEPAPPLTPSARRCCPGRGRRRAVVEGRRGAVQSAPCATR